MNRSRPQAAILNRIGFEPPSSRPSKRDSKRTKFALQVLALAQRFSKLYWKDEVRSSGKNAVFELKMRRLGNSKYSRHFQKARIIGRFLAYSLTEKCRRRCHWRRERNWDRNLLHVGQCTYASCVPAKSTAKAT